MSTRTWKRPPGHYPRIRKSSTLGQRSWPTVTGLDPEEGRCLVVALVVLFCSWVTLGDKLF